MNNITVTGSNADLTTGNDSDITTGAIVGNSDVYASKVLDTADPIYSGDEIQYTITYGNNGPDSGDLTITETYPTNFTTSSPSSFLISSLA